MKKFFGIFLALGLAFLGSLVSMVFADDAPEEVKASPSINVPLHPDWLVTDYNDVKDVTRIQTKDEFGPGNPPHCDRGDAIKVDLVAAFSGKTFGSDSSFSARFYFYRMAGTKYNSDGLVFHGHDKDWRPFDTDSNRLLVFDDENTVYFLTPSGERFACEGEDVSHDTKTSTGMMSEIYLWETVTAVMDLDHLKKLSDGAKVAIGDRVIVFGPDQVSLVRSFLAKLDSMKP